MVGAPHIGGVRHSGVPVDVLGALCEGIDETGGNAVEHRTDHRLQRPARECVLHGVDNFAGIGCQLMKLPGASQSRKWPADQFDINTCWEIVRVAGREHLPDPGKADGNGRLHAVFVTMMDLCPTTPWHEFRIFLDVRNQLEHLGATVGNEDRTLYCMHRVD